MGKSARNNACGKPGKAVALQIAVVVAQQGAGTAFVMGAVSGCCTCHSGDWRAGWEIWSAWALEEVQGKVTIHCWSNLALQKCQ